MVKGDDDGNTKPVEVPGDPCGLAFRVGEADGTTTSPLPTSAFFFHRICSRAASGFIWVRVCVIGLNKPAPVGLTGLASTLPDRGVGL
jgi:hypothetical protein